MAGTVKDLQDALKGPVSRELMKREGRRIGPKPEDNDVHEDASMHADLDDVERKQVEAGGHIEGLDEE